MSLLVAAAAYHGTARLLGDRALDPLARRRAPPAWPLPPAGPPHPAWPRLADLRSPDVAQRETGLAALLALRPGDLPHPAHRPEAWSAELRGFARTLLWRLYRGQPYRLDGLEIRLERPEAGPARAGAPAGLRLTARSIDGMRRPRFPIHLDGLEEIGGRLELFCRPHNALTTVVPPAESRTPALELEPVHDVRPLVSSRLAAATFRAPGDHVIVAVVDLEDAAGPGVPRGLLISNALPVTVVPGE
ncbi:MAG: hypothetical protein JXQ29_01240 [Planctomycetes bacterium]|nr:hypothetical protein [Planctomycetota bacterium]